jgi:hypothetical protein
VVNGALWFQRLSASLKDLRFTPSRADACVFTRRSGGHLAIIAVYVDDLLITASFDAHLDTIIEEIRSSYPDVKASTGVSQSFLGLLIQKRGAVITVAQPAYIDTLASEYDAKEATTPATKTLLTDSEGPAIDRKGYASLIMKIMYLALTRPDVLFTVTYLAPRVNQATEQDFNRALRIIGYLKRLRTSG